MSLRDDIKPYIDGYGLITPNKYDSSIGVRGCDNGPMFLSEYYILLQKNNELISGSDNLSYGFVLDKCLTTSGIGKMLNRAPNDLDQEGPDDYYGVLAALTMFKAGNIPLSFLNHGYSNFGAFNNNGSTPYLQAFLWRQPQLYTATLAAADKLRFYHLPFTMITALIIATSCMWVDLNDTDARRLSWLLIQTMSSKSLLCKLASKIWFWRGRKQYGVDNFMQVVASKYYELGHPFIKYWVTE